MTLRSRALFVVLLFTASLALAAGPQREVPVTDVLVTPGVVQWRAIVPADGISVSVLGPDGETITKDSRSPNVNVTVQDLGSLDGTYSWQLYVTPPIGADVKTKLKEARRNNDDKGVRKIMRDAGLDHILAQSGAFTILNGSFVSPDLQEKSGRPASAAATMSSAAGTVGGRVGAATARSVTPRPLDIVDADDVIVQGSLCVGLDCVVNESFGFDTIRLKENNTRIKFQDTSTATGFPTVDWQLTANDSASGGASKFSIEDIDRQTVPFTVMDGAATNSVFVGSNSKVGFRNSSPGLDLHMTTTDTPAVRMEQTSGGGFTAQTWDIGANEANWFVRDLTGGSRLPLRIRPGAPTSSIDISASGNVGVGTASPRSPLDLRVPTMASGLGLVIDDGTYGVYTSFGDAINFDYSRNAAGSGFLNYVGYLNGTTQYRDLYIGNGRGVTIATFQAATGYFGLGVAPTNPIQHSNGAILTGGGVWQNASSREKKDDICDLDTAEARAAFERLEPVKFTYKADRSERHVGFIAEDVPELVASKDRKSLSPMDIVALLTKVVQDQQKTIDNLSHRIEELEKARP